MKKLPTQSQIQIKQTPKSITKNVSNSAMKCV